MSQTNRNISKTRNITKIEDKHAKKKTIRNIFTVVCGNEMSHVILNKT